MMFRRRRTAEPASFMPWKHRPIPPSYRVLVEQLQPGDYVTIAGLRRAGLPHFDRRPDERFARVEHIELLPSRFDTGLAGLSLPVVALFCQGMPGPVVVHGSIEVIDSMRPERARHDSRTPSWQSSASPYFADASILGAGPHRKSKRPPGRVRGDAETGQHDQRSVEWDFPRQVGRPAAAFRKPARALLVGDYLQTHARFPAADRDTDEGFHRVCWVGCLDTEPTNRVLAPQARKSLGWPEGSLTLVAVDGVYGVLLLPELDVQVLTSPNPERQAEDIYIAGDQDEPGVWVPESRARTAAETATAHAVDEHLRPSPPPDEDDLYPQTVFGLERELLFRGRDGMRLVPLSQLPWPHLLIKCDLVEKISEIARTYPERPATRGRAGWNRDDAAQAAGAEAFHQLAHENGFSACDRHRANWALIGAVAADLTRQGVTDGAEVARHVAADDRLNDDDRSWLYWLFVDPIMWDDGNTIVANGQHRICALRAAGVDHCPVQGRHLPDPPPPTISATQQARRTVEAFWTTVLADRYGHNVVTRLAGLLLARRPQLRRWVKGPRTEDYH